MNSLKAMLVISLTVFLLGCAEKITVEHSSIPDHSHYYPYTQNLGDEYHVRLEISHDNGVMALIFEDVSENEVRLIRTKTINALVVFPDGKREKLVLRIPKEPFQGRHRDSHPVKQLTKRRAGEFIYKASWIHSTPQFDLEVTFPFKGKDFNFVFNYKSTEKMKSFHRK